MEIKIEDIAQGKLTAQQGEELHQYFQQGGTWQTLLQLKPEQVDELYGAGNQYYRDGQYDQALAAFSALIQINPYSASYWVALGATLQAQKEYADALASYEIALTMAHDHIPTLYYSAQCAFALDMPKESKEFLEQVITLCQEKQEELLLGEKAKKILRLLEGAA